MSSVVSDDRLHAASAPLPEPGTAVLLIGRDLPMLAVARALSRRGCRVIAGLPESEMRCTRFSRHVREVWRHPPTGRKADSEFGDALAALLARRPEIRTVFPVSPDMLDRIAACAHDVPEGVAIAGPDPEVAEICLDTARILELAIWCGVPCQPFVVLEPGDDILAAAGDIGYPLVVRPPGHRRGHGGMTAFIAADRPDMALAFPDWPEGQRQLILQRHAAGERRSQYFAAHEGEILRLVELRTQRTDSPDGTGRTVHGETVAINPRLARQTRLLAEALGYTGIGCARYIRDAESGAVSFLGLEPGVAPGHAFAEAAGCELAFAALALAHGADAVVGDRPFGYAPGLGCAWTLGDLKGLASALAVGAVTAAEALHWAREIARAWLDADADLTWHWRDPLPTLLLTLSALPGIGAIIARAGRRPARPDRAEAVS